MSASRLTVLRGAVSWRNARPRIANLGTLSNSLALSPRNVYPSPAGLASGFTSMGKRSLSERHLDEEDKYLFKNFPEARAQQEAGTDRFKGYVVIRNLHDQDSHLNFGRFFLRENCQCSKCVHPETKQKAIEAFSIPENISPGSIEHKGEEVHMTWSDGHSSVYPTEWLVAHQHNNYQRHSRFKDEIYSQKSFPVRQSSTFEPSKPSYPEVAYGDVMSKDSGVSEWLENIYKWGFCFVKGVPINPESTKTLIERIAFIRHTHYGGFWDFTADLTFKDTAYTNEGLGGHTDNTYFTDPARLQLFHLLSHTEGSGGESLLVDTFGAARELQKRNDLFYRVLMTSRHPWHASGNEDVCIQPSAFAPVFSVHPDMNTVYQVRWNNYDRAPKSHWDHQEQDLWYAAARCYDEILRESKRQIWTQLEPGTALIFDNWRMLHGRSEFTGKRRMCGGYVNNDDFISRLRLLKYGREKVVTNLGNLGHEEENPYSVY